VNGRSPPCLGRAYRLSRKRQRRAECRATPCSARLVAEAPRFAAISDVGVPPSGGPVEAPCAPLHDRRTFRLGTVALGDRRPFRSIVSGSASDGPLCNQRPTQEKTQPPGARGEVQGGRAERGLQGRRPRGDEPVSPRAPARGPDGCAAPALRHCLTVRPAGRRPSETPRRRPQDERPRPPRRQATPRAGAARCAAGA